MITKRELIERICALETDSEFMMEEYSKLEKRVKKLEPKKVRKSTVKKEKKSDKVSK